LSDVCAKINNEDIFLIQHNLPRASGVLRKLV